MKFIATLHSRYADKGVLTTRWFLLSVALMIVGLAYSQQHGQDKKQPAKSEQTGTENKPFIVKIAPTIKTVAETKQEEEERDAKRRAEELKQKTDADLAVFTEKVADYTKALFVVGAIQAAFILFQLLFIWRQETATKTIERAYVKMSPSEPGITILDKATGKFQFKIEVKNHGATPARITDVVTSTKEIPATEPLTEIPDYTMPETHVPPEGFLVSAESFFVDYIGTFANVGGIRDKTIMFYMVGYVDYIDKFGKRYRGGFARFYDPVRAAGQNLSYVIQRGYNYDRPRKKNEGRDLGEKTPS